MNSFKHFHWRYYPLIFTNPITTSRGSLSKRETYFLIGEVGDHHYQIGEVGYLPGLTLDDWSTYNQDLPPALSQLSHEKVNYVKNGELDNAPSLRFGWEMLSPQNYLRDCPQEFLNGKWGIPINGLVWMGDKDFQHQQITSLLDRGFTTIKLKIGGLDFSQELALLNLLFAEAQKQKIKITVRLDANGSLGSLNDLGSLDDNAGKKSSKKQTSQALDKLKQLAHYPIHSIEQPLLPLHQGKITPQNYLEVMRESPIPIAWDEELIGVTSLKAKQKLLDDFRPQYLVLKPGIHGGFTQCEEWINLAEDRGMGWWITSALESNLALTAISAWTAAMLHRYRYDDSPTDNRLTQGLGTGGLYQNNFTSPLTLEGDKLFYDPSQEEAMNADVLRKINLY